MPAAWYAQWPHPHSAGHELAVACSMLIFSCTACTAGHLVLHDISRAGRPPQHNGAGEAGRLGPAGVQEGQGLGLGGRQQLDAVQYVISGLQRQHPCQQQAFGQTKLMAGSGRWRWPARALGARPGTAAATPLLLLAPTPLQKPSPGQQCQTVHEASHHCRFMLGHLFAAPPGPSRERRAPAAAGRRLRGRCRPRAPGQRSGMPARGEARAPRWQLERANM